MDTGTSIVVMTVIRFPSISDYNIDAQVLSPRYQRLKYRVNRLFQFPEASNELQRCLGYQ